MRRRGILATIRNNVRILVVKGDLQLRPAREAGTVCETYGVRLQLCGKHLKCDLTIDASQTLLAMAVVMAGRMATYQRVACIRSENGLQ